MKQSTQNTHVSGTPALAAARAALTAAGQQYATSHDLPYADRQDLHDEVVDTAANVDLAERAERRQL